MIMNAVELKLQPSTGYRCHKLVWSQDSHVVPEELQDRIAPEEWAATCAVVDRFYHEQHKAQHSFRTSMNKIRWFPSSDSTVVSTKKWRNVVLAKEQEKYKARGVNMSLVMAKAQGREFPKGVRFEVAPIEIASV